MIGGALAALQKMHFLVSAPPRDTTKRKQLIRCDSEHPASYHHSTNTMDGPKVAEALEEVKKYYKGRHDYWTRQKRRCPELTGTADRELQRLTETKATIISNKVSEILSKQLSPTAPAPMPASASVPAAGSSSATALLARLKGKNLTKEEKVLLGQSRRRTHVASMAAMKSVGTSISGQIQCSENIDKGRSNAMQVLDEENAKESEFLGLLFDHHLEEPNNSAENDASKKPKAMQRGKQQCRKRQPPVQEPPYSLPHITPTFAMVALKEHPKYKILCLSMLERRSPTKSGTLKSHRRWLPSTRTVPALNIFLVGCRDEERPSIDGRGRSRTSVPYFVAHARDPKASKPRYLRLSDLEKKSEVRVSIEAAPLKSV